MNTNTQKVLHDLSVRMSSFPLVEVPPFLLVKTDDGTRNLLAREAGKQKAKRYTGQPITMWGDDL